MITTLLRQLTAWLHDPKDISCAFCLLGIFIYSAVLRDHIVRFVDTDKNQIPHLIFMLRIVHTAEL